MNRDADERLERGVAELATRTIATLTASGAKDEAIATLTPVRRVLLVTRPPVMVPIGRAWRLGVLLLDRNGRFSATGSLTRATEPGWVTNQSPGVEARRENRRAATRGPFARGEVINFNVSALDTSVAALRAGSGPLSVVDEVVMVRWDRAQNEQGLIDLASYLADRAALFTLD